MAGDNPKAIVNKKYIETDKFNGWVRFFTDPKNKETYGNATKSALKVYNTKNYDSASVIGHENLKKLKHVASIYAETRGVGYGQMIDIALAKMAQAQSPEWWDRLMKMFGYADFIESKGTKVSVGIIFNKGDYEY